MKKIKKLKRPTDSDINELIERAKLLQFLIKEAFDKNKAVDSNIQELIDISAKCMEDVWMAAKELYEEEE